MTNPHSVARYLLSSQPSGLLAAAAALVVATCETSTAQPPMSEPVVARIEMKLAIDEKVVDVIAKGDLLTVVEEREDDYVIVTHDGSKGAVDKVNVSQIAESGDIYTDLIELNPTEGRYYTLRASSWWALGNAERALEDFDKAIDLGYQAPHAYTSRGLFHAEMGNFDEAIADYNEALRLDPEDLSPLINRAAVYMSQREFLHAAADYTRVLEERKESVSLLHQRAIALKAAGRLEDAAADFAAILDKQPENYSAIMGRGYLRFQQQKHELAIKDFSRAIELNPKDAVAFNNRGYNRHQLGDFAGALDDYAAAIKLAPNYALALQNRAWLLATAADESFRDPAAAVLAAKQACELSNYESIADLSVLGAALASDGQFDEAVGWQEKVVEAVADPYKDFAQKTLLRYQSERPFAADPDKAAAEERAAEEAKARAKKQQASQIVEDEPKA